MATRKDDSKEGSSAGPLQLTALYPWRLPSPFCSTLEVLERYCKLGYDEFNICPIMMLLPLIRMHPLMVYNSLTRTKVRFIPRDPKSITWYQCGPTVYAESHVGHARTYVTLDIIVRIMREFLGYNVILCQNVSKCYLSGSWFVRCSTRQ